jgi:hypothetical protein
VVRRATFIENEKAIKKAEEMKKYDEQKRREI